MVTWRWRLVGQSHPYAAEVIPVGDVIIHWRGPDCPCSPAVSFERHEDEPDGQNVTETWLHREHNWRRFIYWQPGERAKVKATFNRRVRRTVKRRVRERDRDW